MKISFVIPCYRSEHTLPGVVAELERVMAQRPSYEYEIILTDDGSPDGVWPVIEGLAAADARIKAIRFTRNFGQHAALLAGLSAVSGDAAFCLDDDGQAPVDELFKLVDELDKGYDVVFGAYPEIKQNGFRRFGSWTASPGSQSPARVCMTHSSPATRPTRFPLPWEWPGPGRCGGKTTM